MFHNLKHRNCLIHCSIIYLFMYVELFIYLYTKLEIRYDVAFHFCLVAIHLHIKVVNNLSHS